MRQFLPFFRRPLRPVRLAGLKRGTDIFRPGSLPFFFFPGIRFQIVGQRQGPVPVSLFGDLPSGPSGKGLAVLIFVVLPVHFLVFMIRQFFLSLLPLGHVMIQFINLGTTDDPSVPFLFESRPFAAGRFQFLYFFIDFPDFTFQFFPALSPVGRELRHVGQFLHVFHGILAPLVHVPGRQRHGYFFNLLLRFFNAQAQPFLDLMGLLFFFLQRCKFFFIIR